MKVYFVCVFEYISNDWLHTIEGNRVVGFYEDLETAKRCIEENWLDISEEGFYEYAVIEDVGPGLYQSIKAHPIFYKWIGDGNSGKYKRIRKPRSLKNTCGFTIG